MSRSSSFGLGAAGICCALLLPAACRYQPAGDPAAVVQEFYRRYPDNLHGGLPDAKDRAWLRGFLSEGLIREFQATVQYQKDWIRRHPDRPRQGDRPAVIVKPPFACGVHFTGVEDAGVLVRVSPARRRAVGVWEVPLHLSFGPESSKWHAMAVVINQRGRYLIHDVEFLPTEPSEQSWTITQALRSRED